MLLILDVDYTLNQFYPPSIRDLAPAELIAENGPPLWDWIVEHLSTVDYPAQEEAVEVLQWLNRYDPLVVVSTGRPEALRSVTEQWLRQHFHFDQLCMRPTGDFRLNAEVKRDNLARIILPLGEGHEPYAFDDDTGALAMYVQEGVRAFAAPTCWGQLRAQLQGEVDHALVRSVLTGGL
jgi:hypothetical protein